MGELQWTAGPVDEFVLEVIRARLRRPDVADLLTVAESPEARGAGAAVRKLRTRLHAVLAGMEYAQVQAEMPEVWALAGAGQGFETFAAAVRARQEIEVAMRKLTVQRGPD